MASTAAKARRKAEAVNRLDDLAVQVAERFGVQVPDLRVTAKDPELEQIQQMEATAELLAAIIESQSEPEAAATEAPAEPGNEQEIKAAAKPSKAAKKSRRKASKG